VATPCVCVFQRVDGRSLTTKFLFDVIRFRGRLKRKGPADQAYEKKTLNASYVGSDARVRTFLAGIAFTKPDATASNSSEAESVRDWSNDAGSLRAPVGNVMPAWSECLDAESQPAFVGGLTGFFACSRAHESQPRLTAADANQSEQDRHVNNNRIRRHHTSYRQFGSADWQRGPSTLNAPQHTRHTDQLVSSYCVDTEDVSQCHATLPTDDDLTLLQSNCVVNSTNHCLSAQCFSSTQCSFASEVMTDNWSSPNPDSAGFGSSSNYHYQPTVFDSIFPVNPL